MKRSIHVVAGLTTALLLAACGGGGGGGAGGTSTAAVMAATSNTTVAISPANGAAAVQAVVAQPLTFAAGVPALGTAGPTTLTIASSTSGPTFSVAAAGGQASGRLGFGSCVFTVTTSTFVAPHPLAPGSVSTISPCSISVATAGLPATGAAGSAEVQMVLGTAASTPVSVPVAVSPTGTVTVNGSTLPATVSTAPVTGAS